MILIAALALSSTTPAHAQQGKLEEAVMALPVASLSFSMTYLADDLNLWEKHGVKIKTVEISGIGVLRNPVKDEAAASATRAA